MSRMRPYAQLAITKAPMMPASGSIQSQPKARASSSPMITSTETAASASYVNEGRTHVVVPMGGVVMRVVVLFEHHRIVLSGNTDVSGESMRLGNRVLAFEPALPTRIVNTWRAPPGRTVSTATPSGLGRGPLSARSRNTGGTPSSKILEDKSAAQALDTVLPIVIMMRSATMPMMVGVSVVVMMITPAQ